VQSAVQGGQCRGGTLETSSPHEAWRDCTYPDIGDIDEPVFTLGEVRKLTGLTYDPLQTRISRGDLPVVRFEEDGDLFVTETDLLTFVQEEQERNRLDANRISINEAAALIGRSRSYIYKAVCDGRLPSYPYGPNNRLNPSDVLEFAEADRRRRGPVQSGRTA
jgi:excisionase family DNA binding protein